MNLAMVRIALAASTALTVAAPALAQDSPSGGDIVVTARRSEERLQDVPISISVYNQEELSKRNVTNAQDLANFTPSLSVTTNFGAENSTFALRGFVQETGTGPSVGVYFADVVAPRGASQGFPAGDGAGPGSFFDLQNVQVLKGPQGTLFGRNTTGGAVLLVPQKPTDEFGGYVEASMGNYDMQRLQGVINLPLGETLRLRLGGDYQKRDGFMKNDTDIGPKDFDDVNYYALRASLVWDVTPDIENYTIASYTDSDNNGHVQKLFACNRDASPLNFLGQLACAQLARNTNQRYNTGSGFYHLNSDMPDPYSKLKQWQVINTTSWQVNDNLQIKNIASYARLKTKIHSDLFGTNFIIPRGAFGQVPVAPGVFVPYPFNDTPQGFAVIRNIPGGYSSNQDTFTEEFRLQGKALDGRLDWQVGAYYENSTPNGFIGSQSPVVIGCSDPDNLICTDLTGGGVVNYTAAKNSTRTIGLYSQASYKLTDQLSLTGGFRYTWDKTRSVSRGISNYFPVGVPDASPNRIVCTIPPTAAQPNSALPDCENDRKASFSAPTWLIGLDYKPNDDMMLYGKYSRGYRTGGIKSDVPEEFIVFQPEKVDTFEVGAKTTFRGAVRGNLNIAAFYNNFSNQQIQFGFNQNPASATIVTPTAGPVNVGKSRIWGIELDGRLSVFDGFTLTGAYTYLNTRVKEVVTPILPPTSPYLASGSVQVGDPLALSPKHKFTVGAVYELPVPEEAGRVSIGVNYSYVARQLSNYANRVYTGPVSYDGVTDSPNVDFGMLPSYQLVDLNVTWESIAGSPLDLAFFATNLFKEKYLSQVPGLFPSIGSEIGTVGAPQMFGVRARINFGAK